MSVFLKKIMWVIIVLVAFFSIFNFVLSQESISNEISSIDLSFFPIYPSPGDSVILNISSDLIDLDFSKIFWYIDGVLRKETVSKSITVKTKTGGQKTTIRVVVETSDGVVKEVSTEISPVGVDFIVEPVSYTMPFYKGKPFLIGEGVVKIVAIPDIIVGGIRIPTKDLTFKWSKDDSVLGLNSGRGKNSVIINSTIPVRDINMSLQVLDDSGLVLAEKSKTIILNNPKVLFYENNPLYGILYNKAIGGSYSLGTREELKITAKPFSFSFSKDTPGEANFLWYVNDSYVAPVGKNNEITLRQTVTGQGGEVFVSLDLNNINKINQYAGGGFNLEFGQ